MSFRYHGLQYGVHAYVPEVFTHAEFHPEKHIDAIRDVIDQPSNRTRWDCGFDDPHDVTHGFDSLAHRHYQTPGFDLAAHTFAAGDYVTVPDPRTKRMTVGLVLGLHVDDMVQGWEQMDRGHGQDNYPRGPWAFCNTLSPLVVHGRELHLDKATGSGDVVSIDALGNALRIGDSVVVTHPEESHMDIAVIASVDDRQGAMTVYVMEARSYPTSGVLKAQSHPILPPLHPTVNLKLERTWGPLDKGIRHGRLTPDVKTPHGAYLDQSELDAHRARTGLPHIHHHPAGPQHAHDRRAQYAVVRATISLSPK